MTTRWRSYLAYLDRPARGRRSRAWGVFRPGSGAHAAWAAISGSDAVPLRSARMEVFHLGDLGPTPAYLIDLAALPPGVFSRLARDLAGRSGEAARWAQATLIAEGCPVRTDDLFVTDDREEGRRFWAAEMARGG